MKLSFQSLLITLLGLLSINKSLGYHELNIIGYYGNSGASPNFIPLLGDIACYYNVLVLTFINFNAQQELEFKFIGPYAYNLAKFKRDIDTWKSVPDPYNRRRTVLVSIGGQNGRLLSNISSAQIESQLIGFLVEYGLDGLHVDLEGGAISAASSLTDVLASLKSNGYIISAAPEAASVTFSGYADVLRQVTYYHAQFYNNPPNAVAAPFAPRNTGGQYPTDWQDPTPRGWANNGTTWWVNVLNTVNDYYGFYRSQRGMLVPAAPKAAGSYNRWNLPALKSQIIEANLSYVGTWAIAYDNEQNWEFGRIMASIMSSTSLC